MVDAALQAEADWLNADTTIRTLLPNGVLPYIRDDPPAQQPVCWLFRTRIDETRVANQLKRTTHTLQLRVKWPLKTAAANILATQDMLDQTVTALLARIRDAGGDKTHGYFSWVGEANLGQGVPGIQVAYLDAEQCIRQTIPLQADITYTAVQDSIAA